MPPASFVRNVYGFQAEASPVVVDVGQASGL